MVDLTILELHLDVDASDFPFGEKSASDEAERLTGAESGGRRRPARGTGAARGSGGGIGDRIPVRLLAVVAVLVLAVGAVVAAKLLGRDPVDDLAGAF